MVVRSRRVPTRLVEVRSPRFSHPGGWMSTPSVRAVEYESKLDEENLKAIEDARRIADQMGLRLEILDESRSGLITRALAALRRGFAPSPKLVITPAYAPPGDGPCVGAIGTAR